MADHVAVDPARLEAVAAGLGRVGAALRSTDDPAGPDREVFGHPALASVMGDVAGSWRVHREHLLESVDAHRAMASAAADGYRALDRGLADAFSADPR